MEYKFWIHGTEIKQIQDNDLAMSRCNLIDCSNKFFKSPGNL